jgi:hypothetical protein
MDDNSARDSVSDRPRTIFHSAASEVLAQRLEAIALEMRAAGTSKAGLFASEESFGLLAAILQGTLKKIDEIFEFDGFVFTPACSLLLELFQAKSRGSTISHTALCQAINCSESVAGRWVNVLESVQLIEKFGGDKDDEIRVSLTKRGHLKTIEALKLLL